VPEADNRASATHVAVSVAGTAVPESELVRMVVDIDLNQPAMAVITLHNAGSRHSNSHKQGDAIEVKVGDSGGTTIFKGEIVGIEPIFEAGADSKCIIRAFDRLHRLLRGRKSRTFQKQSDKDIVSTIVGDHGLSAQFGSEPPTTKYEHVYQHAQNDLEFLRTRAARIGRCVWVDDQTLHFEKPKTDQDSGIEFKLTANAEGGHRMKKFAPRMSSAGVVKKVTVRGWDPEKKQEIVGEATAASSKLGATNAASASDAFGEVKTFTVDQPIASVEEAKAIAQAKLDDLAMGFITGEAECFGNPTYKPGIVVKITVNEEQTDDVFNGKYFVNGVAHVYSHASGGSGGYNTILKVARDAQKGQ
jgi:phage protein D